MKKVELEVLGLSFSQTQSGAYAVVLDEVGGDRRLPIIIGTFEAHAISIQKENIKISRPITHDLFKSFAGAYGIKVSEVIIYKLHEGIFYAKLVCEQNGVVREIDSRTSDALAIALRFQAPIYTYENIIGIAGIKIDETDDASYTPEEFSDEKKKEASDELAESSLKELEQKLNAAIENEDYELASKLRDEINRRTS